MGTLRSPAGVAFPFSRLIQALREMWAKAQAQTLVQRLSELAWFTCAHTLLARAGLMARAKVTVEGLCHVGKGCGHGEVENWGSRQPAQGLQDMLWPCSLRQAGP